MEEREFQCFSILVSQQNIPTIKEILRACRAQLAQVSSPAGDRVYQVNLQFFPLTRAIVGSRPGHSKSAFGSIKA
jgi:hypothetical protein